jgi:hypothetical protein
MPAVLLLLGDSAAAAAVVIAAVQPLSADACRQLSWVRIIC